jgi:hypothetical protein
MLPENFATYMTLDKIQAFYFSDTNNKANSNVQNWKFYRDNIAPYITLEDYLDGDKLYEKIYRASKSENRGYAKNKSTKFPDRLGPKLKPLGDHTIVMILNAFLKLFDNYPILKDNVYFQQQKAKLKLKAQNLDITDQELKKDIDKDLEIIDFKAVIPEIERIYSDRTKKDIFQTRLLVLLLAELPARDNFQLKVTTNLADFETADTNFIYIGQKPYEVRLNEFKTAGSKKRARSHEPIQVALSTYLTDQIEDYMSRYNIRTGDYLLGKKKHGQILSGVYTQLGINRGRFGGGQYTRRAVSKFNKDAETARLMGHSTQTHLGPYQTTSVADTASVRIQLAAIPRATTGGGSKSATPVTTPNGHNLRSRHVSFGEDIVHNIPLDNSGMAEAEEELRELQESNIATLQLPRPISYTFKLVPDVELFALDVKLDNA